VGEIQQGRYDRLLRRTTAQVGPGSKVGNALEDLFPTIEVENTPSELLRAVGWTLGAGQSIIVPAAGTKAVIQLFNPPGSGHLITLTHLMVSVSVNGSINMGPSFAALTGTSTAGQQRDTRDEVLSETVGLIQEQDDALIANLQNVILLLNQTFQITDSNDIAVLAPGTGWRLGAAAIDVALRISFLWRERVAEPEELSF